MKKMMKQYILVLAMFSTMGAATVFAEISQKELDSISTPDKVQTSIGTLKFLDGAPYPKTAEKVYEYIDTMRGVDVFMKGMQGASLHGIITGIRGIGAEEAHQVVIFEQLGDSKPLYLTLNTSTLYVMPTLDHQA